MNHKLSVILAALAGLVVVCVGGVMIAGGHDPLGGLDVRVFDAATAHRGVGTSHLVSYFSDVFSPLAVTVATAVLAVFFAVHDRELSRAGIVLAAVAGGGVVCEGLKILVARPRPPYVGQLVHETGMSYPSGHVTGSTALLIALALVLSVRATARSRRIAVAGAVVLALLVAASRLYLQVHWTSDVLAGFIVGSAAAAVSMVIVPDVVAYLMRQIRARRGSPEGRHHRATV